MVKHIYRLGIVAVLLGLSACEVTIGSNPKTPPTEDVTTQDPPGNTATRSGASDESVAETGTGGGIATSRPPQPQSQAQPQSPPQPIAQTSTSFETPAVGSRIRPQAIFLSMMQTVNGSLASKGDIR